MHFYVAVDTDSGTYYCVACAGSEFYAEKKAMSHYREEGEEVYSAEAQMFNTYEHGDITDYEILE